MSITPKASIIIPTYNERDNIEVLADRIHRVVSDYELVVVDDSSPDGTAEVVARLSSKYPVRLIKRSAKMGYASAQMDGFLAAKGTILGTMDADLQHPPEVIPKLIQAANETTIAIGSRYVKDGHIEGWPLWRRTMSKVATIMARPLTRASDPLSGFFFIHRNAINGVTSLQPRGFELLLEILVRGDYQNIAEVPYTFYVRERGESKLGSQEITSYLMLLWLLSRNRSRRP